MRILLFGFPAHMKLNRPPKKQMEPGHEEFQKESLIPNVNFPAWVT